MIYSGRNDDRMIEEIHEDIEDIDRIQMIEKIETRRKTDEVRAKVWWRILRSHE
jgi:hypothetical protein